MKKACCLGVTGGIGSGKSYVCRMLQEKGIPVFYTDDEAKLEMLENPQIHSELISLIGPDAISAEGRPVKPVLSAYICQGEEFAARVNAIVHPRVKERTMRWQQAHASSPVIAIECALLFESGFEDLCDKTITVAAPHEVRIQRICKRDTITPSKAQEWIDLQMPQEDKIQRSDFVILNDGIEPILPQIDKILTQIQ